MGMVLAVTIEEWRADPHQGSQGTVEGEPRYPDLQAYFSSRIPRFIY